MIESKRDLPLELWEKIYKSLPLSDRIRFSSVCKAWLSIAAAKPQPPLPLQPWLMFHNNTKFLSLSDNRVYKFDKVIPQNWTILGASNGWLLITKRCSRHQDPKTKPIFLVNPIVHAKIKLPPLHGKAAKLGFIKKLIVVVDESNTPIGVIIYFARSDCHTLFSITCDVADRPWIQTTLISSFVHDILLYNRKLYCVGMNSFYPITHITTYALDEQLKPHMENMPRVVEGTDQAYWPMPNSSYETRAYLVESHGSLLLVKSYTNRFQVFKLWLGDYYGRCCGVRLPSIGDEAFFLGKDGCVALPVGDCELFQENRIYFSVGYSAGVFSLDFGTGQPFADLSSECIKQKPAWFVPTNKGTIVDLDRVYKNKNLDSKSLLSLGS